MVHSGYRSDSDSDSDSDNLFSLEELLLKRKITFEKINMIIGCMYRHPTNELHFCTKLGNFNIDLLKIDTNEDANNFVTNVTSQFFTPFILQPTRIKSKTLIDNIFINTIEYPSYNGNLTVQLS